MGECSVCGKSNVLTRTCNYCGRTFCTAHTLPEKHECLGLENVGAFTKHLQSEIDAKLKGEYGDAATRFGRGTRANDVDSGTEAGRVTEATLRTDRSGDSGPDVAPDGSLVHEESELDAELDRMRREATREGSEWSTRMAVSGKIGLKRSKAALFDLRLWLLVGVLLAADYAGYVDLPALPI